MLVLNSNYFLLPLLGNASELVPSIPLALKEFWIFNDRRDIRGIALCFQISSGCAAKAYWDHIKKNHPKYDVNTLLNFYDRPALLNLFALLFQTTKLTCPALSIYSQYLNPKIIIPYLMRGIKIRWWKKAPPDASIQKDAVTSFADDRYIGVINTS